ncbi:MAG: hypothetical protein WCR08_08835 [Gammaproteobacteria bacterium]
MPSLKRMQISKSNRTDVADRFPWKKSILVYSASYGLMFFFAGAYFWDDWIVYQKLSRSEIAHLMWLRGDWSTRIWLEDGLLKLRPELFRSGVFIGYFLVGWLLFYILKTLPFISSSNRQFIVLVFLVLPINSARVAMVDFAYCVSLVYFYFAWFLLVSKRSVSAVFFAFVFFLLSFGATASLMFFLVIPAVHFAYIKYRNQECYSLKNLIVLFALTLMSPLFWFLDRRYNPPQGKWLSMYSLQKFNVVRALLLLVFVVAIIVGINKKINVRALQRRMLLCSLGSVITVIGAMPYIAAGHMVTASSWMLNFVPQESDWDSRHQLLLGLGFALFIVGLVGEVDSKLKNLFVLAIVGVCVLLNLTYMHAYYLDSLKQVEFIEAVRNEPKLMNSKIVMIEDQAIQFNARGRGIRSYEWDSMFQVANSDLKITTVYKSYVDCKSRKIPDTLLKISTTNGRFKASVLGQVGIRIDVSHIEPCK